MQRALKAAIKALIERLPARRQGRIDWALYQHLGWAAWPMNGQAHRLEIARSIIERCGIERIIETGTYKGTTTEWLASFDLPVDTVEINPRFHEFAALRLARFANVALHLGNSVEVLERAKEDAAVCAARLFIYLDAHWRDYLPLADELQIILAHMPHAVVMIDDFQVSDDPGYGYDEYGSGRALTAAYLTALGYPGHAFYPVAPSRWETGAKRGCVVLAADADMGARLDGLPCLRRARLACSGA